MAYIPKNKYQVLYTKGNEFRLAADRGRVGASLPYTGKYIKLDNGKLFAGDNPNNIIGSLVEIKKSYSNIKSGNNNSTYSILKPRIAEEQNKNIPIPSSTPPPTALDYSRGYFYRYLSVRLNTKQYQEISLDVFENFNNRNYNRKLNKVFRIEWSLSENNEVINTKTLTRLQYQLPGIFKFFPNKGQYGLLNGVIFLTPTSRIYPSGELIPKILPAAYQIGNEQINSVSNPNVPNNHHCGNCGLNNKGHCNRWKANIKNNYWCRAYVNILEYEDPSIPENIPPPPYTPPPPGDTVSTEGVSTTPSSPPSTPSRPPTTTSSPRGGGGY